jgi:nucleotide-binding universal stress UspA family protein
MKLERILVPVDFSDHSRHALDYAIGVAEKFGSKVHVLHVFEIPIAAVSAYDMGGATAPAPINLWSDLEGIARDQLAKWMEETDSRGIEISSSMVTERPATAIVSEATALPADLIVMGTRGLSGLSHIVLGSVAERTLRTAPCPVLTLKLDD